MYKETRSLEKIYHSAVSGLYARIRSYYDSLYKKFGDDGIKLIEEMSRTFGLEVAKRAEKNIQNNDIASVATFLLKIFETVNHGRNNTELVKTSDTEIIIKAVDCPLHFTDPKMCLAHTTMEKTVVETLNPKLSYRIGKSTPAGDAFCEHILEIK
jgi:hypothetical protein